VAGFITPGVSSFEWALQSRYYISISIIEFPSRLARSLMVS
jgi:hypothetical protein